MSATRPLFALFLLTSLAAGACADEWTDALATELGKPKKPKVVLAAYEQVITAKHARAADACFRRIQLFAQDGKEKETQAELERMLKDFPKKYTAVVEKALKNVKGFIGDAGGERRIKARLGAQQVSLNLNQTPIHEALAFVQDISGLNIYVLPDVDARTQVSLRLQNISLENAFKLILAADADLEWKIQGNLIVIGKDMASVKPRVWSAKEIETNPDMAWKLLSRTMSLNFSDTSLLDVADFLGQLGTPMQLSDEVKGANPDYTARLKDVALVDVMNVLLGSQGFRWHVTESGISVNAR